MNKPLKTLVVGLFLAGTLAASGCLPVIRDYDDWSDNDNNSYWRQELREDTIALARARAKLEYDLRHGASERTLAADRARIRQLEDEIREDRRRLAWSR